MCLFKSRQHVFWQLAIFYLVLALSTAASAQSLPIGTLVHDGPATPEQLSLFLPVTGSLTLSATATVRYKPTNSSTWITGHPLFRVRPGFSTNPEVGNVPEAFASWFPNRQIQWGGVYSNLGAV